ncbi:MAG TPA: hypothetical protein PLD59_07785 [Tepidisphaeraceae bacterium]|nr:hypothetical protein [Tepidisphaeraceae bacterium]
MSILVILSVFTLAPVYASVTTFESTSPGASEADAINQAIDEAAQTLAPIVRDRAQLLLKKQHLLPTAPPSIEAMRGLLAEALRDGGVIIDSSAKKHARPYGDVYYATLSLDVTPNWLNQTARRAAGLAARDRHRDFVLFGGAAGMIATVSILYLAANALTKGYYRNRLRFTAICALIAGSALVAAARYAPPRGVMVGGELKQTVEPRTIHNAWQN